MGESSATVDSSEQTEQASVVCFGEGWETRCYVIITSSSTFLQEEGAWELQAESVTVMSLKADSGDYASHGANARPSTHI